MWVTQTWVATPYWMVRSRLWRASGLAVPDRIIVADGITKTKCDHQAHKFAGRPIAAKRLAGEWETSGTERVAAIAPDFTAGNYRKWQAIGMDESFFVGVNELAQPAALKVDLHALSCSWWFEGQLVAVLCGLVTQPLRREA